MADTHTHDSGESHSHGDATAGHSHDAAPMAATGPVYAEQTPAGGVAGRLILGALGAIMIIVSAFLAWLGGTAGTKVEMQVFFTPDIQGNSGFLGSAGLVVIVIGLIGLLGLASRSGSVLRIAGALAIVAFVLFTISAIRAGGDFGEILGNYEIGMWLLLLGGLLTLIAGFIPARRAVEIT